VDVAKMLLAQAIVLSWYRDAAEIVARNILLTATDNCVGVVYSTKDTTTHSRHLKSTL